MVESYRLTVRSKDIEPSPVFLNWILSKAKSEVGKVIHL